MQIKNWSHANNSLLVACEGPADWTCTVWGVLSLPSLYPLIYLQTVLFTCWKSCFFLFADVKKDLKNLDAKDKETKASQRGLRKVGQKVEKRTIPTRRSVRLIEDETKRAAVLADIEAAGSKELPENDAAPDYYNPG